MLVSHDCSKLHQRKKNPTLPPAEAAQVEKRVGEALDAAVGTYVSSGEYIDCRSMRPSEYEGGTGAGEGAPVHTRRVLLALRLSESAAASAASAVADKIKGTGSAAARQRQQHHRDSGVEKYSNLL